MTNKLIKVTVRQEYGNIRCFPKNKTAELVCQLIGKKTLNATHIVLLEQLGFEVKAATEAVELPQAE